jgi:hypothetical protein
MAIMNVKEESPPNANMGVALVTRPEDIRNHLTEIIEIISKRMIPRATDDETHALHLKTLADCVDASEIPAIGSGCRPNDVQAKF